MPEGHVLHRLAGEITAWLTGPVAVSSPQGRFSPEAAALDGRELVTAQAYGKHLFIGFDNDDWIHIHLGLIGTMSLAVPADPQGQVRLRLANDDVAADLRGPQTCRLIGSETKDRLTSSLGPDPLRDDADPDRSWRRIRASVKPIATLLMDQSVVAGVGNIYRAEALFRANVDPYLPAKNLPAHTWVAIWSDLVELMHDGVRTGRIDTVGPQHTPEAMDRPPRRDDHGGEVYVYRRRDQPCHVCATPIRSATLAGRSLYWCPTCQA